MRELTYRDAIKEALKEEMENDHTVFLLGEDIADPFGGVFSVTAGLTDMFGKDRVINTPLAEAAIIGAALGSAMTGLKPVAEIMYIDFITVAMDQVVNQVAKLRYMSGGQIEAPLVIRTPQGAGRSSAAQHAQSFESIFMHIPGIKVVMPSNPEDAKGLLKTAIRDKDPVLFIEHKLLYNTKGLVQEGEFFIPFGEAKIRREGNDITLVATSSMVDLALEAAEKLAIEGISVEVIDPRTIVPLDKETIINSVMKTGRLVVTHEAVEKGGFGAELAAIVQKEAFDYLDAPIVRVAAKDVPVPFAPNLEDYVIPNTEDIIDGIKKII